MKIYNIIKIDYIPVTNHRPSRVKLTDTRLKETKIIPYDYAFNSIEDMAIDYLKSKKIKVIAQADGYLIIAPINNTFKSIK